MKTHAAILVLALVAVLPLFAQEHHPNLPKGFDADKVYDFNELDHIDLFTGGLRTTLPLGPRYPINGELSYGFTLVYNSAIWDILPGTYVIWPAGDPQPTLIPYVDTRPGHRVNAGPGWLLSFGKVFPPGPYNNSNAWLYESEDGNDREIGNLDTVGAIAYSRDATYIRAKRTTTTEVTLEFPDGAIHTFKRNPSNNDDWRLDQIRDRFNNKMWIVYEPDGSWTIKDDHLREHKVYFASKNYHNAYGSKFVSRVVLAGFNGDTSEYVFNYQDASYDNSCENDGIYTLDSYTSPFLTSITMPDTSAFEFKYQNSIGSAYTQKCEMGAMTSMRLPTGGFVKWDYVLVHLPTDPCVIGFYRSAGSVPGVGTRSLLNESQAAEGRTTTYTYAKSPDLSNCGGTQSEYTTTTMKTADGARTVHYFSVWPAQYVSPNGHRENERGLPYRRLPAPDKRKLSQEFLGTCTANCSPLRSIYVNYEYEKSPALPESKRGFNRRQTYEKVVMHDDGNKYIENSWSNFDGVGHFRNLLTTSNIGGDESRFETTLWDATTGEMKVAEDGTILTDVVRPATTVPWILNTFYWKSVTENDKELVSEFCFDKTTGFMTRTRMKAGDGTNDLLTVFSHTLPSPFSSAQNGKGNILREEFYGGDNQEVATGTLVCDTTLPAAGPKYTVYHEYQHGTRNSTTYKDAPFKSLDQVIDKNTGLVDESRDTAGILTEYNYDKYARMTEAKTTGRATTKISYDTVARPPVTTIEALDPATAAVLTKARFFYDPWGRTIQSREQMDSGWATINTTYDVMGRRSTVSSPEYRSTANYEGPSVFVPAAVTTTLYDLFGHVTRVTSPDTSKIEYAYEGERKKTITQWVATALGQADTPIVTTEEYDHRERLVKMVEKSGPTNVASPVGANVTTEYSYDPANRLLGVKMTASGGVVQHRIFDYDGRGVLTWESHPESGMTTYTYDARGHVLSKRQSAADSPFDLNYQYDFAERLTLLSSRNPQAPATFRPLKEFEFGTANLPAPNNKTDFSKGKLIRSTRYNYGSEWDDIYKVDNYYDYIDDAGRLHGRRQKITKIDDWGWEEVMKELTMSVKLNALDKIDEISYPMCVGCGAPPTNPQRLPKHHYSFGRLTRIDNVVGSLANPITYWPNGMRRKLPHQNGMTDNQEVGSMARATEISFKTYDRCVAPTFSTQPAGGTGPTNLTVSMNGTAPFQYEWSSYPDSGGWGIAGTTQSISVNPTVRTTYSVTVANACGYVTSQDAIVIPSGCEAPTTGWIEVVLQPDGSWILRPNPTARTPRTYQWKRVSDNAIVGTSETLAVGTLSQTTTYSFTITDSCGSATSNVTIKVPLPMTTTAFSANWNPATGIRLSWPSSSGATGYTIERRAGTTWEYLTSVTGTQFDDTAIQSNKTYAYRVYATSSGSQSGYSNSDIATTYTYSPAVAGTYVTASSFNTTLDAVNKIREAAGMPAVSWANILSPNDPLPNPGVIITGRHILACRARMTEALQALGAPPRSYVDPDPILKTIRALHVNEIQDQTK